MTRERPLDKNVAQFVRFHLGRDAFAALTGVDMPAWHAFVHLLQLYGREPTDKAVTALRSVVDLAQPREAILMPFVQAIPGVLDWGYVATIWPRICDGWTEATPEVWTLAAVERESAKGPVLRRWGWGHPT